MRETAASTEVRGREYKRPRACRCLAARHSFYWREPLFIADSVLVSSNVLFAYRFLAMGFITGVIIWGIIRDEGSFFKYLTNLSLLWDWAFYITAVATHMRLFRVNHHNGRPPIRLSKVVKSIYSIAFANECIVTLGYWIGANTEESTVANGYSILAHGVILAVITVDTLINHLYFMPHGVLIAFLFDLCYIAFLYIYYAASGNWVYRFLGDYSYHWVAYFVGAIALLIFFGIGILLTIIRDKIYISRHKGDWTGHRWFADTKLLRTERWRVVLDRTAGSRFPLESATAQTAQDQPTIINLSG
eukprot:GILK01013032.1.p1 GENE.GILK01013032.1~~GILK01013032.1.p1  ORF type:complete len:303 (-),score=19.18 GILK01013032.1:233-1141(-)